MKTLTALSTALLSAVIAAPVMADVTAEESCGYQGDVVAAIQQARLDRVKERTLSETLTAAEPSWPDNFNAAIPLIAPWVYEQKMKVIRNEDLGEVWKERCLDQIQ
jgi:hypothetical protein